MAAFIPPRVFVPAAVVIRDGRLWAPPSETRVRFPIAGAWRSFAESDPEDVGQIEAIARRFGGLTRDAGTDAGEWLLGWTQLLSDLRYLHSAWTDTGALDTPLTVSAARTAANQIQQLVLAEHQRTGGGFEVDGTEWALRCQNMAQWWRMTAIKDARLGAPMRRCRHCGTWFSLTGLRSDAGFCLPAHRSAFYQKRPPASRFWAEVI
jgi:hypothetical protein